jgi:hypothetical protein
MSDLMKSDVSTIADHLKLIVNQYIKEIKYLKLYILAIALVTILSYSVYIFFSVETVSNLGQEDHFFEWSTCIFFFLASAFFFSSFMKAKNLFFLILAIVMFIGGGEEISWGQRILGFGTPESLEKINVQHEFTFHNIWIFQGVDSHGRPIFDYRRLFEINFLFRVFTLFCGIILPFCVYHFKLLSSVARKLLIPIPPITIGFFFFVNWLIYWVIHAFLLPSNSPVQYIDTAGEIFECLASFILFIVSLYFYNYHKNIPVGKDIKQII